MTFGRLPLPQFSCAIFISLAVEGGEILGGGLKFFFVQQPLFSFRFHLIFLGSNLSYLVHQLEYLCMGDYFIPFL